MKRSGLILGSIIILLAAAFVLTEFKVSNLKSNIAKIAGLNIKSNVVATGATEIIEYVTNVDGHEIPYRKITLSTSKDSAVANGTDNITITVGILKLIADSRTPDASPSNPVPDCGFYVNPPTFPASFYFKVSGSNNTYNTGRTEISCSTGHASTTLKSGAAEQKNISLLVEGKGSEYNPGISLNTNFSAPASSTPQNTPSTTNEGTTSTTPDATPTEEVPNPNAPTAPVVENIAVGDEQFTVDKEQRIEFKQGSRITFSGKAIPNAEVILYFSSDPFVVTIKSNEEGAWSYLLTKNLGPGEHSLQVAVTDPATNLTSEKSEPLQFIIRENDQSTTVPDTKSTTSTSNIIYYMLLSSIILIIVGSIIAIIIHDKRRSKKIKNKISILPK